MSDLISRDKAIKMLDIYIKPFVGLIGDMGSSINGAREIIKSIPAATPKKGRWIEHPMHIECDQCRVWFLKKHLIRNSYCPNCGAKMKRGR